MKTIIWAYAEANGADAGRPLAETDPAKQSEIMAAAAQRHEFPEGVKRLEFHVLGDPAEIQSFISEDVAKYVQAGHAKTVAESKSAKESLSAERSAGNRLIEARKIFNSAVQKRNSAIADVAAQKNILAGNLTEKDKAAVLAKIEKFQPLADAASNQLETVREQFEIIRSPKSTAEQSAAAFEALKSLSAPKAG